MADPGAPPKRLSRILPDLESLPVAKGRPKGRLCFTCRERKPYTEFPRALARKCTACWEAGVVVVHDAVCEVCGETFEGATTAKYCSDKCRSRVSYVRSKKS